MNHVDELKLKPSTERAEEIIYLINNDPIMLTANAQSQSAWTNLLKYSIPELWDHFSFTCRSNLINLFSTTGGLSCIVARINLCAATEQLTYVQVTCEFLASILDYHRDQLVVRLARHNDGTSDDGNSGKNKGNGNSEQICSLFVGSRILSCLAMAYRVIQEGTHSDTFSDKWAEYSSGHKYVQYVTKQLCALVRQTDASSSGLACQFFQKLIRLGHIDASAPVFYCKDNLVVPQTLMSLLPSRSTAQWMVLESYVLPSIQKQHLSGWGPTVISTIDATFVAARVSDVAAMTLSLFGDWANRSSSEREHSHSKGAATANPLLRYAESARANVLMRRVLVLCCESLGTLETEFNLLIERWADKLAIAHNAVAVQEAQTELILLSLPHLSTKFIDSLSISKVYLDGISNRLAALTEYSRVMGIVVGEYVSKHASDSSKLKFGLEGLDELRASFDVIAQVRDKARVGFDPDTIWDKLNESAFFVDEREVDHIAEDHGGEASDIDTALLLDSDDEGTDDSLEPYPFEDNEEDSDDDPTLVRKEKVRAPVYIKDLISYLTADDYEKLKIALDTGENLVLCKAAYGQELAFYGRQLAETLAAVKDQYDLEEFDKKRISILSSLVASVPQEVAPYLISLVFTADYSLHQRISVLTSLSLGALQLAGRIENPAGSLPPETKRLPPGVHELFIEGRSDGYAQKAMNYLTFDVQNQLMASTSEEVKDDLIGGPKIVRISASLKRRRQTGGGLTTLTTNKYSKIAGPVFFFPLMAQWDDTGRYYDLGIYTDILCGHFLKTMSLLFFAACPSSNDQVSMTAELLGLVLSLRAKASVPVIEGLLSCLLVALEATDELELVNKWPRELAEIQAWLSDSWESIPDDKVRSMAAAVLYKIVKISEKWERQLLGEYATM